MKKDKTFEDTLSSKIVKSQIDGYRNFFHYGKNEQIADIKVDRTQDPPVILYKLVESKFGNKVFGYDFKDSRSYINKEEKDIIKYIFNIYIEKNITKKQDMQKKLYKKIEKMHKNKENKVHKKLIISDR